MAIVKKTWMNNAFWENHQKDRVTAILRVVDDKGRVTNQTVTARKYDDQGKRTRDFHEIVQEVGELQINENTAQRHERKQKEQQEKLQRQQSIQKAKALESLFDAKIQVMEIPEIQESKNRELKAKLRKARNTVELNMYAQIIVMEQLGYATKTTTD